MGKKLTAAPESLEQTLHAIQEVMSWQAKLVRDALRQARELSARPGPRPGARRKASRDR